jgi:hypothetical protein
LGYSARYHAASLAAVFLALAVGILIGAEFGGDVITGTSESLEKSLQSDVEEARAEADQLRAELERQSDFTERVYPALVADRLSGRRVAVVALGGLGEEVSTDIEEALEPTGAEIGAVAVVREPPDLDALAEAAPQRQFRGLRRDGRALAGLSERTGRALAEGGELFERLRGALLSRFSGEQGRIDAVVVVRDRPDDLDPDQQEDADALEAGLLDGLRRAGSPIVGVERSTDEESSIELFASHNLASVDSVDLLAGRLATVLALTGAKGQFGVKDTADRLLPDLLPPARPRSRG